MSMMSLLQRVKRAPQQYKQRQKVLANIKESKAARYGRHGINRMIGSEQATGFAVGLDRFYNRNKFTVNDWEKLGRHAIGDGAMQFARASRTSMRTRLYAPPSVYRPK